MMYCPLCSTPLRSVERQGVEIDHCPQCGGLWLDQGELDRIVQNEAILALQEGQRRLADARRSREYDVRPLEDAPPPKRQPSADTL